MTTQSTSPGKSVCVSGQFKGGEERITAIEKHRTERVELLMKRYCLLPHRAGESGLVNLGPQSTNGSAGPGILPPHAAELARAGG